MPSEFDRLFGKLPSAMLRHEDGTAACDKSHPLVKAFLAAVKSCREAGMSEAEVVAVVEAGWLHGSSKRSGGDDGR